MIVGIKNVLTVEQHDAITKVTKLGHNHTLLAEELYFILDY